MMHTHSKKGFTVIEALVAISILLLSIVGAFAVAQSSLRSSNLAKNRITAYYLAQEAIEYVRHVRDNNGLEMLNDRSSDISWLNGLADPGNPCEIGKVCRIDTTEVSAPTECLNGVCPNLLRDSSTGLFQYVSGEDSHFNRSLQISQACPGGCNDREIVVSVTVGWDQSGVQQSLTISENLYNWQQIASD